MVLSLLFPVSVELFPQFEIYKYFNMGMCISMILIALTVCLIYFLNINAILGAFAVETTPGRTDRKRRNP